ATADASAIDPAAFPNSNIGSAQYWSSTSDPLGPDFGLLYRFQDTEAQSGTLKSSQLLVRLVRGGRFLDAHAPGGDATPDTFTFPGKGAAPSTLVVSAAVTVSGLAGPASIRVSGAAQSAYSI